MTYSIAKLTLKEPTEAEVKLTPALAKTLHELHRKKREGMFHLCIIAYGLRKRNLQKSRVKTSGGNAKGERYKPAFLTWYRKNYIDQVYGSITNFTLYAMAGRVLNYVRWQLDEKYIARMPSSLTALYQISQILSEQGGKVTAQGKKLLRQMLTTTRKDGSGPGTHIIHPQVTRTEIQSYVQRLTFQKSGKVASEMPSGIPLCTVYVTDSLMDFTKTTRTKRKNTVTLEQAKRLHEILSEVVSRHSERPNEFWIEKNQLERIQEKYDSKTDFGKHIREDEQE